MGIWQPSKVKGTTDTHIKPYSWVYVKKKKNQYAMLSLCIDSHSWLKCWKEKDSLKFTMGRTPKLKLQENGMKLMTEDSPAPLWCRGNLWQTTGRSRESAFHV